MRHYPGAAVNALWMNAAGTAELQLPGGAPRIRVCPAILHIKSDSYNHS